MRADFIWKNGELCTWERAQVHVMTHGLHYGSSVFEGLRAYEIGDDAAIFRGPEHFERLIYSCKVARMPSPLSVDEWMKVTADTLRANQHRSAYIRPLVFRGCGESMALDGRKGPIEAILATIQWGTYFGQDALQQGVDVQVSSWRRAGPGAQSAMAKIGGHYIATQNILMEARDNGYIDGIALDLGGNVSEGSGTNVFLVHKGRLLTPSLGDSILGGITRDCIISIARDIGVPVVEMGIPREMLYLADEAFFTGTAAEVCPVRSIDRLPVGDGRRGPVTEAIQGAFFGIIRGAKPDKWNWLARVRVASAEGAGRA